MQGLTYVEPVLPLIVLVILFGAWKARKTSPSQFLLVAAVLFLWSWPPAAMLLGGTLEWWYSPERLPGKDAQAIVVLSAGAHFPVPERPPVLPGRENEIRCRYAAWLYLNGWKVPVVASGGIDRGRDVAEVMREVLLKEGVAGEDVWLGANGQSTYEQALQTARLLRPRNIKRIVLVTQAYHMPRSERCFRRAGFEVDPAPCGFRATTLDPTIEQWLPSASAIRENDDVLHEWAGLAWYALRGRL